MDKNIFYLARYPKSKLSDSEKLCLFKEKPKWVKDIDTARYYKEYCAFMNVDEETIGNWYYYCKFGDRDFRITLNKKSHKEVTFENSPVEIKI